jgi:hypothetical protein
MASANFFNGYSVDKPTSKVMAPPGGRSNNIFGGQEDQAPAPDHRKQKTLVNNSNVPEQHQAQQQSNKVEDKYNNQGSKSRRGKTN